MAITLSEIRRSNETKRVSDLELSLPELKEKYGFDFDVHGTNLDEVFKLHYKVTSGDNGSDGITYIRVDNGATTELGRLLKLSSPRSFKTWVGNCGNLRNYIDFLTIKNYPADLVKKQRLNKTDIQSIPRGARISVPNYWALLAAGFVDKVRSDQVLYKLLKENQLPFVAHNQSSAVSLLGVSLNVSGHDIKLAKYIAIIRSIETFVKNDKLNDKTFIENWIKDCRDYDCELFEGIAIKLN